MSSNSQDAIAGNAHAGACRISLEVLAAPRERRQIEEAHHLLDFGLDVGV